jgi:hypothetical protein
MRVGKTNIMSRQDLEFYGHPEQVNERLKQIISKFSKQESDVFQILQGQARSTIELLDLLESSINCTSCELEAIKRELKRTTRKVESLSQGVLL